MVEEFYFLLDFKIKIKKKPLRIRIFLLIKRLRRVNGTKTNISYRPAVKCNYGMKFFSSKYSCVQCQLSDHKLSVNWLLKYKK